MSAVCTPRFNPGRIVATPGALALCEEYGIDLSAHLLRHIAGDWGDLCGSDKRANERALRDGSRILSAYDLPEGGKLWIITEWDRSATTVLLPDEY